MQRDETMLLSTPTRTLLASPLLTLIAAANARQKKPSDAVALSQVQTLTLRGHDAATTHRRVPAVPQLRCLSHPSLCALAEPGLDVLRCENMGSSYDDETVEWSCTASLPEELKLGSTDVICEGYDSADDPFVLKGSCGVEYRLALTDKGQRRYPDLGKLSRNGGGAEGEGAGAWGPLLFFLAVVVIMFGLAMLNRRSGNGGNGRGQWRNGGGNDPWGGGGGGGGWDPDSRGGFDDDNDPPPPYSGSRKSQGGSWRGAGQQQQGWQPGFWSGLATGGAAGYAASRTGGRNNQRDDSSRRQTRSGGIFSRGGNSDSSSGSRSGSSGASYETTGHGSTSRR